MNKKNRFKQAVIRASVKLEGVKHPEATRQVEESITVYPERTWQVPEHCDDPDCLCGGRMRPYYEPALHVAQVNEKRYFHIGIDGLYSYDILPDKSGWVEGSMKVADPTFCI